MPPSFKFCVTICTFIIIIIAIAIAIVIAIIVIIVIITIAIAIAIITIIIIIISRHMLWVVSKILSQRGHRISKLITEYRKEELMSAVVPYVALKELAHGIVCFSESHQGLNFHDII